VQLVLAQRDTLHQNHKFYYGLGFGFGKGSEKGGYSNGFIYLQRKTNYIAIKSSGISRFELFGDEPSPSISDLGIIVGKSYTFNRYLNLQFGAGVALTERISRGKFLYSTCKSWFCLVGHDVYETIERRSIGFPLEVKSNFYAGRGTALYLGLNANLNSDPFCGVSLGFVFGRLRDRIRKY